MWKGEKVLTVLERVMLSGFLVVALHFKSLETKWWIIMEDNGLNSQKYKYLGDEFFNEVQIQSEFLLIHDTMCKLWQHFIFRNYGDCNLTFVREFYSNWIIDTWYNKFVPIWVRLYAFPLKCQTCFSTPYYDAVDYNRLKEPPFLYIY